MKPIFQRQIGDTELQVTELGFGGAAIGNLYSPITDNDAALAVRVSYESGIRFFDTAPLYGYGLGEHRLGAVLRHMDRDSFVLSTKIGRMLRPSTLQRPEELFPESLAFTPFFDYSYDATMRSLEDSLQRLGLDRIDIALIHDVEVSTHGTQTEADKRFREVMEGGYRALKELKDAGVIKAIGGGMNEWEACERFAKAADFDCFLLAGRYTLLEQNALDSFLPLCQKKKISIIVGGPYNTGILATGAVDGSYFNYKPADAATKAQVTRIENICRRHNTPLAAAALEFPLHHPTVACVIPGCRSKSELELNLGTYWYDVPSDLWAELKHEGLLREDAPTP